LNLKLLCAKQSIPNPSNLKLLFANDQS
jgi:hypothetical protein